MPPPRIGPTTGDAQNPLASPAVNQGVWAGATSAPPVAMTPGGPVGAVGTGGDGLAPMTGWAAGQNFNPAELEANIYSTPFALLNRALPGLDSSMPGYQALRDFGADPLAIYNMTNGAQGMMMGGSGEYANFLANLYQNLGTAGGQGFDMREMLGNIFGQSVVGKESPNALGQLMGTGGVSEQIKLIYGLLRDASNVGMNPLAARAYQSAIAGAGDEYASMAMGTNSAAIPGYAQWLAQKYPHLAAR